VLQAHKQPSEDARNFLLFCEIFVWQRFQVGFKTGLPSHLIASFKKFGHF